MFFFFFFFSRLNSACGTISIFEDQAFWCTLGGPAASLDWPLIGADSDMLTCLRLPCRVLIGQFNTDR